MVDRFLPTFRGLCPAARPGIGALGSNGIFSLLAPSELPVIAAAREQTEERLSGLREDLKELEADDDASVVLMGSWGRRELTAKSDDDFMLLFCGDERRDPKPSRGDVSALLGVGASQPGREGIFGQEVWLPDLRDRLGPKDTNENLSRRMLLILESVPVLGASSQEAARRTLIESYLDAHALHYRPPRFFINDLVRYWRTIAVDFESKFRERGGEGWGIRNAKLRLSRKLLFAGGLFPLLRCSDLELEAMPEFLDEQFSVPPLDRIADAFGKHELEDAGARVLLAYEEFLGMLDDPEQRATLEALRIEDADSSATFKRVRELGKELQASLLTLLFDDEKMRPLAREYLIF